MSMTTQNWQSVESGRDLAKSRKPADAMAYLAVLVILAAIIALMAIFCSIGSVERSSARLHASPTSFAPEE
jgi:hypothetical protein